MRGEDDDVQGEYEVVVGIAQHLLRKGSFEREAGI